MRIRGRRTRIRLRLRQADQPARDKFCRLRTAADSAAIRAARQQETREWWDTRRSLFQLVCSELVIREASAGDPAAAADRLKALAGLPVLAASDAAAELAARLIAEVRLPARAQADALHVAIAATNGVHYLLTWNCRHLSNAVLRPRIESTCRDAGYEPPTICEPPQLMEGTP